MHKKILTAVGITILFLGLAIQPSVAVQPSTSDSDDDCDICVSDRHPMCDILDVVLDKHSYFLASLLRIANELFTIGIPSAVISLFVITVGFMVSIIMYPVFSLYITVFDCTRI